MPARIWWIATAFTTLVFAVSMTSELTGLTTLCGLSLVLGGFLLAVPSLVTGGIAIATTYSEYSARTGDVGCKPRRGALRHTVVSPA